MAPGFSTWTVKQAWPYGSFDLYSTVLLVGLLAGSRFC
jgi:hypothetical protein